MHPRGAQDRLAVGPVDVPIELADVSDVEHADPIDDHVPREDGLQRSIDHGCHQPPGHRTTEVRKRADEHGRAEYDDPRRGVRRGAPRVHQKASPMPNASATGMPKSVGWTPNVGSPWHFEFAYAASLPLAHGRSCKKGIRYAISSRMGPTGVS